MEYKQALIIKEKWDGKYCTHPKFEKLYYAGAFLVSYVCPLCGAEFTVSQKMEVEEIRHIQKK